jgi:putative transposase
MRKINHSNPEFRTGRHCIFNMHVHLVFVTKYRKSVLKNKHIVSLKTLFSSVCADFESELIECNGEEDHVHLLITYPPKVSIAKLVNSLKGVSSRKLKQLHPELNKKYFNGALWTPSYFSASCGGAPLDIIKQYVQSQRVVNEQS